MMDFADVEKEILRILKTDGPMKNINLLALAKMYFTDTFVIVLEDMLKRGTLRYDLDWQVAIETNPDTFPNG